MKTIYIKNGDWQSIFHNVKLQAFTLNLVEFYQYLQSSTVDRYGRIQSNFVQQQIDALVNNDKNTYYQMEQQSKQIVKQARQLGLRAAYNNLDRLHLRDLV